MSCQKLNRKCLHLLSNQGRGMYSLRHLDISSLFYPSTAAAEAKAKKTKDVINKLGVVGTMGRLPGPSISFRPYTSVVPNTYSLTNVFALFGGSKNKIFCSDELGSTIIYNTELNSLMSVPELNSPKGLQSMVVFVPCTTADTTANLYILDMLPASRCSFEMLSYNPIENWSWRPLPSLPFFNDPEYKAPLYSPTFVVDDTRIFVSSTNATYAFNTVACEWSKVGDWVLPFKAEYVPELGLWLGLSEHAPYDLCALEGLSTAVASSPPTVQPVGNEFEPPKSWSLVLRTLVNVGSGRFCIANVFDIFTDEEMYEVAVFTGVEVLPGGSGLRMIKHKTKCFTACVTDVL